MYTNVGISDKHGQVTVEKGKLDRGEPVFVILARDKLASAVLEHYAVLANRAGCADDFVKQIREAAEKMQNWPIKNLPD